MKKKINDKDVVDKNVENKKGFGVLKNKKDKNKIKGGAENNGANEADVVNEADENNKPDDVSENDSDNKTTDVVEVTEESKELEVIEGRREVVVKKGNKKSKKKQKLPAIFRKKYTKRAFQRKILKKIYIPKDKEYINSLFVQESSDNPKKPGKFYIPEDLNFSAPDLRKIRAIAKQIKKQKGRVKLLPLIAAFSFIFAIVFVIVSMKNVLIARGIRSFFEYQFEARCDMASVDLRFFDSSFTVRGFQIANKDKPMENVFSFDSLIIDFDMLQLLKARVVAEELSLNGMDTGSKRSYNGTLPEHKLSKIRAKKAAKAKKAEEKKEMIKTALNNATNQVKDNVKDSIINIFNTFNPQIILESCYSQFETPDMAKTIQDQTVVFIDKWKATPERVNTQVQNVKTSTENIINFDYASIKDDPKKIKDMLANFDAAFKTLDGVKTETERIAADIAEDVEIVNDLLIDVQDSIVHDIGVGKDKIDELQSFRLPSGQEFLASTIDIYGYELLGKYYPMLKKGVSYLIELKDKQLPKKPVVKKEKKEGIKRAAGRNISFVNDRIPKFWIKKMAASGFNGSGLNMEASITNITNNMNMINRPTEGKFKFNYGDIVHGGNVVVDIRTETENPLVYLEYTCDGTSFAHKDGIPGVPQIASDADYICSAKIYDDRPFVLSGVGNFYNLELSTPYFEPEYVHKIYNSILGRFDNAEVELELVIDGIDNVDLHAYTDLDEKIADAFKDEINLRLTEIKDAIEAELSAKIELFKEKAMVIVDKLYAIENRVHELENQLYELEDKLRAKQEELEDKLYALQEHIENKIQENTEKVQEGLKQESERVQKEIEEKLQAEADKRKEKQEKAKEEWQKKQEEKKKAAADAAEDALKGMFGGFKRP